MIGLAFSLIFLPIKILLLVVKVFAELLEHAGHHHRHHGGRGRRTRGHGRRRTRGYVAPPASTAEDVARRSRRRHRFWQVVGILFIIGLIGAHPAVSVVLGALVTGTLILFRQQRIRREREEQQRRDAELAAQLAHAETMAALRPEDIHWLRSAGWRDPNELRDDPLAG